MRLLAMLTLLFAACSAPPARRGDSSSGPGSKPAAGEKDLVVDRRAETVEDRREIPLPSEAERRDFDRIWELYRRGDPRWPRERDRFKLRSEAAGYLLAAHLMRHYMRVNAARAQAGRQLARVKEQIEAVGPPCAPALVQLMVLDRIRLRDGEWFYVDDLTRQDCREMLGRMGRGALPELLHALKRRDLGWKARRHVALALGETRQPTAREPLENLLANDPAWQVRADAATALATLGDPRALPALERAVHSDPDKSVVLRAGKARAQLRGGSGR